MKVTLANTFLTALSRGHRQRVAIGELMAVSDRTLRDIGLHRGEVRSLVDGLLRTPTPSQVAERSSATKGTRNTTQTPANDECFEAAA